MSEHDHDLINCYIRVKSENKNYKLVKVGKICKDPECDYFIGVDSDGK